MGREGGAEPAAVSSGCLFFKTRDVGLIIGGSLGLGRGTPGPRSWELLGAPGPPAGSSQPTAQPPLTPLQSAIKPVLQTLSLLQSLQRVELAVRFLLVGTS